MHFIYIIYSRKADKYYVGETNDLELRLTKHNSHSYEGSFTKSADDWEMVLTFKCFSRNQALLLEKFVKRMKSKVFIQKVINNPEILKDIISNNNF